MQIAIGAQSYYIFVSIDSLLHVHYYEVNYYSKTNLPKPV